MNVEGKTQVYCTYHKDYYHHYPPYYIHKHIPHNVFQHIQVGIYMFQYLSRKLLFHKVHSHSFLYLLVRIYFMISEFKIEEVLFIISG